MFDTIRQFEEEKWEILHFQQIFMFLGFNKESYENLFNMKKPFTSAKILAIEKDPNGFLPNTPNFLFLNIFLTFMTFLLIRLLIKLFSSWKIVKFF
jgi:hypothetical protein